MTMPHRWIPLATLAGLLLVAATSPAQQAPAAPPAEKAEAVAPAAAPAADAAKASPTESAAAPVAAAPPVAAPVAPVAPPPPVPAEDEKTNWLLQIFGPGMWPLWFCSIALVALLLERRRALRPDRILDPTMIDRVADLVSEGKVDEAQQAAAASATVLGKAWAQGLHEFSLGGAGLADTLSNSTLLAFKPLKKNLLPLATLGVVSPLLGLLGTVLGMIVVFHQIMATGGADKGKLAGGIGLALFTTAGGLIVAIPAILGNRYFVSRLTGLAEQAEEGISRINYRHAHAMARRAAGNAGDKK